MLDDEGSRGEFLRLLAEFGEEPAFIRRAAAVEHSQSAFNKRVQRDRDELLRWPRIHFSSLQRRVTGNWNRIRRHLVIPRYSSFYQDFPERFGTAEQRHQTSWTDKAALRAFTDSADRFDRRWIEYVAHMDLDPLNVTRRNYNEYYPIERACAFGTERFNKDFEPLEMISRDQILVDYPLINAPRIRSS